MTRASPGSQLSPHGTPGLSSHPAIAHAVPCARSALPHVASLAASCLCNKAETRVSRTLRGINGSSLCARPGSRCTSTRPVTCITLFNCPAPLLGCGSLQASPCQTRSNSPVGHRAGSMTDTQCRFVGNNWVAVDFTFSCSHVRSLHLGLKGWRVGVTYSRFFLESLHSDILTAPSPARACDCV